ncbi:hypothetical protein FXO38_27549 [Capsicum annuum]|nr:hypothetical protein FXO38_27549 [Capsicum annuum]
MSSKSELHEDVDVGTEEKITTPPDEQRDEPVWPNSQNTTPDELFPSLNVYSSKSIIVHPCANHDVQTLIQKLRIRRPSKFKESPYTIKFGSAAGNIHIFSQKHPFVYQAIDEIVDTKIIKKFMNWISIDLLKGHAKRKENVDHYKKGKLVIPMMHFGVETVEDKNWFYTMGFLISHEQTRSVHDVYSVNDPNLTAGGQETHLNEYINGKLVEIIPLCLQACDFYDKKEIDLQNHPRYKDKDSSYLFDVLFENNLPQQLSGSLDCGLYVVTYAECLSYGHKVLSIEFDPNALRTRYAALL